MQRLIERFEIADRVIGSLSAVLKERPLDAIHRDAAIQRFEYSFEATWKAAQRYLRVIEGMETGSPKQVIRACFESALEIAARLGNHMELLGIWVAIMRKRSVTD